MNKKVQLEGYRKVIVFALISVVAGVLSFFHVLSPELVNFFTWGFGLFVAGNAAEHAADAVKLGQKAGQDLDVLVNSVDNSTVPLDSTVLLDSTGT
jgi:hypothetical protein